MILQFATERFEYAITQLCCQLIALLLYNSTIVVAHARKHFLHIAGVTNSQDNRVLNSLSITLDLQAFHTVRSASPNDSLALALNMLCESEYGCRHLANYSTTIGTSPRRCICSLQPVKGGI